MKYSQISFHFLYFIILLLFFGAEKLVIKMYKYYYFLNYYVSQSSIDPIITTDDINNFEELKKNSRSSIHNIVYSEDLKIEQQKDALKVIHTGFTELPNVYRDSFLNPM